MSGDTGNQLFLFLIEELCFSFPWIIQRLLCKKRLSYDKRIVKISSEQLQSTYAITRKSQTSTSNRKLRQNSSPSFGPVRYVPFQGLRTCWFARAVGLCRCWFRQSHSRVDTNQSLVHTPGTSDTQRPQNRSHAHFFSCSFEVVQIRYHQKKLGAEGAHL